MTTPQPKRDPDDVAAKAAQQTKAARAAQRPAKAGVKPKPPESGKPIWDTPHSS